MKSNTDISTGNSFLPFKISPLVSGIKQAFNTAVQITGYSFLVSHLLLMPDVHADQTGGTVTGGVGNINQSGLTTTINQTSQNMAINWQTFNVAVDERVHYIQPNSSSIALNRILSNTGSTIAGRIDANGQVILVNPNGVIFTPTAQINVGGIIASGLDINVTDFMNSSYIFNEVLGTEGAVINSGTINAALGGNVALFGRRVENNGLISAQLGSVNLAAGKQAVLTFDNNGLLGVRISKEILQNELGVDAAVLNSGNIDAAGGRVLLTSSVSKDVFSQAVNSGDAQARSVVVNADGSFTLGGGADVVNSGNINVSSRDAHAGQIVLLGDNITSSGELRADATQGNGGNIELHANTITQLTQNSMTSARAEQSGTGGDIKLLGNKVGLFDNSTVDASGANGGGNVLIGGDLQGLNGNIRNADFIYLGENTAVKADALDAGNGGKIITFSEDTARIYGNLFARGGVNGGDGGFIETSGLINFQIIKTPDITSTLGSAGEWLIDPNNITIVSGGGNININSSNPFATTNDGAQLGVDLIRTALLGTNANVTITTGTAGLNAEAGNITFSTSLNYDGRGSDTLTLNAANNIVTFGNDIRDNDTSSGADSLNIVFNANSDSLNGGDVLIASSEIDTNGGSFTATGVNFTSSRGGTNTDTLDTSGGNVTLNMTGVINIGAEIITGGGDFSAGFRDQVTPSNSIIPTSFINTREINVSPIAAGVGGNIDINATGDINLGALVLGSLFTSSLGAGSILVDAGNDITLSTALDLDWVNDTTVTFNADRHININASISDPALSDLDITDVSLHADADLNGTGNVTVNADIDTSGGNFSASGVTYTSTNFVLDTSGSGTPTNRGHVVLDMTGAVTLGSITTQSAANSGNLMVTAGGTVTDASGELNIAGTTQFTVGANDIVLDNTNNNFAASVSVVSANNVTLNDTNSIVLGAATISGTLNVTADGDVTQAASTGLAVTGLSSFTATQNNADITLGNTANNLQGAISLSTSGGNSGDITLRNASAVTTLGTVSALGALTVTADHDLVIAGTTSVTNSFSGTNVRAMQLNFGQAVSSTAAFTLNNGAAISTSTGTDDSVNITINSGNNANTFNFNTGSSLSTSNGTITVNGGSAMDTFNLATSIAGTFNAGAGNDVFNINAAGIAITSLQGQGDNDTLAGFTNTANTWNIGNVFGAASNNLNGTVNFQTMESFTGGSLVDTFNINTAISGQVNGGAGNDIFNVNATGLTLASLNGGADSDTLNAANEDNYWSVSNINDGVIYSNAGRTTTRANFTDVETLVGNAQIDDFLIGGSGTIASLHGGTSGAISNVNTLRARQGVSNVWSFTSTTSGSLALVSDPSNPYVGDFSNIQSFVGGGAGNEWSDFSGAGALTINVGNYLGFTGIIGNGASTLTGQDGQINTWSIGVIADQTGVNTDGVNDGQVTAGAGVLRFIDFNTLVGGNGIDNFIVNTGGSITGSLNGGENTNTNTLTAQNTNNSWSITGLNTGNLSITGSPTRYVQDFSNIQSIMGGNTVDTVTVNTLGSITDINTGAGNDNIFLAGTISGLLDGGANSDSLIITATGDQTVELGNRRTVNNLNVYQMESITANNAYNNTLIGDNAVRNTWDVISANAGSVNDTITNTQFTYFSTITGGTGIDEINIANNITTVNTGAGDDIVTMTAGLVNQINLGAGNDTFTVSGSSIVNAGVFGDGDNDTFNVISGNVKVFNGGAGNDTIVYTNPVEITVGDSVGIGVAVNLIEGITTVNGTLNARQDVTTTWAVNGLNQGSVFDSSATTQVMNFSGFTTLNGGNGVDNFTVTGNGAVTGLVSGGDGADTLTFNLGTGIAQSGQLNFDGGAGSNSVTLNGSLAAYNQTYTPDVNLTFNAATNTYDQLAIMNGTNNYAIHYRNVDAVTNSVQVATLTVLGTSAMDQFNLGSDSNGELFQVNANTAVNFTSSAIANLIINGLADDTIDIGSTFNMGTNNLRLIGGTLTNSSNSLLTANNLVIDSLLNNMSGNRLLTNINDLALVNTTGAVLITDNSGLNISQLDNVSALDLIANGNITTGNLNSAAALTLTTTGNITLQNAAETNIQGLTAQNLNINSTGTLNGNGAMVVSGTTILASTGDINLVAANDFNNLNVVSANAVLINDINNIALGAVNAATVNISAGGAITDNNGAANNVTAGSVTLRAATGIGANDAIETSTALLDVINSASGNVNINNTGAVTLTNLVNQSTTLNDSNITFNNDTDVTLDHVAADYQTGGITLTVTNGSVYGILPRVDSNGNSVSFTTVPDIRSNTALISASQSFGTFARPIVMDVRTQIDLLIPTVYQPFLYGNPVFNTLFALQASLLGSINTITGQQLIELESLADIDPAIFTAVRTYNYDDISIRMPSDQLYEDEEEDKKH